MVVWAAVPRGTTLAKAIASESGRGFGEKWMLKYGRQAAAVTVMGHLPTCLGL